MPLEENKFSLGEIIGRINLNKRLYNNELKFLLNNLYYLQLKINRKKETSSVPEFGDKDIIKYHKLIEQLDPNNRFSSIEEILRYVENYRGCK